MSVIYCKYFRDNNFIKMDEDHTPANDNTAEYATYEDFLDSQISAYDLYYLEDEELARQLVELGYRGSGEVLKREEFLARKKAAEANRVQKEISRDDSLIRMKKAKLMNSPKTTHFYPLWLKGKRLTEQEE